MPHPSLRLIASTSLLAALAACQQPAAPDATAANPAVDRLASNPVDAGDRVLLWGDTHLHTRESADAFENGTNNADIDTAYRFARGLPVRHTRTGEVIRIDQPLDFLVVADHAEMLGVLPRMVDGDADVLATSGGQQLADAYRADPDRAYMQTMKLGPHDPVNEIISSLHTPEILRTSWERHIDAAERYNEPGKFTALIGWEWSSTPNGINQHRVVFTPADGDVAKQFLPLSNYDTMAPEGLWRFLRETRARTGADFVAIPHNSNLSQGQMWTQANTDGEEFDAAYAHERLEWERVVEVTQYKGTSETHPTLSANDEFADFEIRETMFGSEPAIPHSGSYVRTGLLAGLAAEGRTGVNPFAFGLIGSTDSHSGLSSQREDEFYGKSGGDLRPQERADAVLGPMNSWVVSAGGIAAVWADHNDRRSIYEAFRRREVYGTSGPRIALRVFGGYGFTPADAQAADFARVGYRKGVPMGGELQRPSRASAPALLIQAVKEPGGANLDRVQVIKGWRTADGSLREKVYNVVWGGNGRLRPDGSLAPVGDTVDRRTARYTNTIGAGELVTLWRDPDFDPALQAFYYVRVLEIPTPRHQLFDAIALGMDPARTNLPLTLQERAWSSPIWYRP